MVFFQDLQVFAFQAMRREENESFYPVSKMSMPEELREVYFSVIVRDIALEVADFIYPETDNVPRHYRLVTKDILKTIEDRDYPDEYFQQTMKSWDTTNLRRSLKETPRSIKQLQNLIVSAVIPPGVQPFSIDDIVWTERVRANGDQKVTNAYNDLLQNLKILLRDHCIIPMGEWKSNTSPNTVEKLTNTMKQYRRYLQSNDSKVTDKWGRYARLRDRWHLLDPDQQDLAYTNINERFRTT